MQNKDSSIFVKTRTSAARRSGQGLSWGLRGDKKCIIQSCTNSILRCPNLWFFKLPHTKTPQMRKQWLQQIGLTEFQLPINTLVCENHFEYGDMGPINPVNKTRTLKKTAIPTLLLPLTSQTISRSKPKHVYQRNTTQDTKCVINPSEEQSTQQESPQDDSIHNADNPNINNQSQMDIDQIMSENNQTSDDDSQKNNDSDQGDNAHYQNNSANSNHNKKHTNSMGTTLANKTLNSLNNLHFRKESKRKQNKKLFSSEYKLKMFQLCLDNIQAYELLHSTLKLPPVSTLYSYIPSTLDVINSLYRSSLVNKFGLMPAINKSGVICVNFMRIKPFIEYDDIKDEVSGINLGSKTAPHQYAMIAMVRGINDEWYHIVSIGFSSSLTIFTELNTFLNEILQMMLEMGFSIKAVVTSTDDMFQDTSAIKYRPYFVIKKHKVNQIFDPAHLMLLLYEELNHHKAFYSEQNNEKKMLVSWEHIHNFYEQDITKKYRLIDQTTSKDKNEILQNRLKSAVQILSLKTALGITMYYNNNMNIVDKSIMETVNFLVRINSIFAALHPKASRYENNISQDEEFWSNNIEYIECITKTFSVTDSNQPKFPDYLICSMKSVMLLQRMYRENNSKLMQSLNHDPLVEFIDDITVKNFKQKYPTAIELFDTLKDGFMKNNYHNITDILPRKLENFIEDAKALSEESCFDKIEDTLKITEISDYKHLNHEEASSMYYVAIYLLDNMYKNHKCALSSRMKYMSSSVFYDNQLKNFCGSIIVPDDEFIEFVNKMDTVFVTSYKKSMGTGKVFEDLMKALNKMCVTGPVDLAPLQYIKQLFLKLRIYHTIKYNNEMFNNYGDAEKFFVCRLNSKGLNV